MGQIAQLHHDGTPVELDLFKGAQVPAGSGQLKLGFGGPSPIETQISTTGNASLPFPVAAWLKPQ